MGTHRYWQGLDRYKRVNTTKLVRDIHESPERDNEYRMRVKAASTGPIALFIKRVWVNRGLFTLVTRDGYTENVPITLLKEQPWYQEGVDQLLRRFRPMDIDALMKCWGLSLAEAEAIVAGKRRLENI